MSRSFNRCEYAHTECSPHKNRIRGSWLRACDSSKDLIAVSHALGDALTILGWQGRVFMCDIDAGVRRQIEYGRRGNGTTLPDYPNLNLFPAGGSVENTVRAYAEQFGVKRLAAVDVDLTACVEGCWSVLSDVLTTLLRHKARGVKVLLTFRNGRRCRFKTLQERISWLQGMLPKGVKYVSHEKYTSLRVGRHVVREKGSSMCIVELQVG
jgi:ribosome modulation factor